MSADPAPADFESFEVPAPARPHRPESATRPIAALAPIRVLVVDDEAPVREVIELCLTSDGHAVATAEDGVSGLEEFCAGTWDMVLVDRAMPRMDGEQLALEIKRRDPQIPVVLVSGLPGLARQPGEDGSAIDAVVRKPFTIATLRDGMARAQRIHAGS